jgi:type IV pilus biogenesis protein CpaD/CtpE
MKKIVLVIMLACLSACAQGYQDPQATMAALNYLNAHPIGLAPMPMPQQPLRTNCLMIGNQMNCSSY